MCYKICYNLSVCSIKFFGTGSISDVNLVELTLKLASLCEFNGEKKKFFFVLQIFFSDDFEFMA